MTCLPFGFLWLPAFAGPPLTMDDPGILQPGQWEIITAGTYTSTSGRDAYQLPLLDISLGVIEDKIQIAMVVPWEHVSPDIGPSGSDLGSVEFGVKWLFFDSERLQMALAPYQVFGVSQSTADKGIGSDADVTVLPLNAQYQLSDTWTLNGELSFANVHGGDDEIGYGAALSFAPGGRFTWLLEMYGGADTSFDDHSIELRTGFDVELRDDLHLLFAAATGLDAPTAYGELDAGIYLGIQLFR